MRGLKPLSTNADLFNRRGVKKPFSIFPLTTSEFTSTT